MKPNSKEYEEKRRDEAHLKRLLDDDRKRRKAAARRAFAEAGRKIMADRIDAAVDFPAFLAGRVGNSDDLAPDVAPASDDPSDNKEHS